MVLDLAYTIALSEAFKKPKAFNQLGFWTHSLGVAYLTRSLARAVKAGPEEIDIAYMCGLMHDVDILVFDYLIPDQYAELLQSIKSTGHTLAEHENKNFGITHAELGKKFIEKWWSVSPNITQAIGIHHDETGSDGNVKPIAHLLNTANLLANQNGFGNGIASEGATPLEYGILDKLDLLDLDELEI